MPDDSNSRLVFVARQYRAARRAHWRRRSALRIVLRLVFKEGYPRKVHGDA